MERRDPLFALSERPIQVITTRLKHVILVETGHYRRGDPLFAHKLSALFLTRWTLTSEYLDCHIPNHTQIQVTEQGDLLRQYKRPVRVLRKSTHLSHLSARVPICLLNVLIKTKTQTKT